MITIKIHQVTHITDYRSLFQKNHNEIGFIKIKKDPRFGEEDDR